MADGVAVAVGKEVARLLSVEKFGMVYDPRRSYADWDLELTESDKLHVDVVSFVTATELETRGHVLYRVSVDIGVRERFSQTQQQGASIDIREIDKLATMVEAIHEYFIKTANLRLPQYEDAAWESTDIRSAGVKEHLKQWNQFTGIVRLTYVVTKTIP